MNNRFSMNDTFVDISSQQPYWYKTWYSTQWDSAYGDHYISIVKRDGKSFLCNGWYKFVEEVLPCHDCHNNYHLKKVGDDTTVIEEDGKYYAIDAFQNRKVRVYTREEAEGFRDLIELDGVQIAIGDAMVYTQEFGYLITLPHGEVQHVLSEAEYHQATVELNTARNVPASRKRPHEDRVADQENDQRRKKPALDNGRFFTPNSPAQKEAHCSADSEVERPPIKVPETWY